VADHRRVCESFLREELDVEPKPNGVTNRTSHVMDFLGRRIFNTHIALNRRSRRRYDQEMKRLDRLVASHSMGDREAQQRSTSLTAFAASAGVRSWRFRQGVLQRLPVIGLGHKPGPARR
jgi:hypothetical protein